MKKIFASVMTLFILISSSISIYADNHSDVLDEYLEYVETTEYYSDYEDQILDVEVLRRVETDEGVRFTVEYILSSENGSQKFMVIIADDNFNIIDAIITIYKEDMVSIVELDSDTTSNIYIQPRKPIAQCVKSTCVRFGVKLDYESAPGCSTIVGQPCKTILLLGHPILYAICRGGVWAVCNLDLELRACLEYVDELVVCDL